MTILLEQYTIPEKGNVELSVQRAFEIKVTAKEAQRQVNRWVLLEVSCVMGAEPPALVVGERVVWRVPVVLTASHVGIVGEVGVINVDVQTGKMDNRPELIELFQQKGVELGRKLPPYKPRSEVPEQYLVKNLQPTHSKPRPRQTLPQASVTFSVAE